MWINLSRHQGGGGGVSMAGSAPHLIPPPGPPSRPAGGGGGSGVVVVAPAAKVLPPTPASKFKRLKIFMRSTKRGRSRKTEKKRRTEEGDGGGSTMNHQSDQPVSSADCFDLQEEEEYRPPPPYTEVGPPSPDPFCEGRAWSPAAAEGSHTHCRRSFRLAGHQASGLANERNMLPMWLEESRGQARQTTYLPRGEAAILDGDTSFETKWDSLRSKNKVRSSCQVEKRPTGWEDIGPTSGVKEKNANVNKNRFCPSFVIREAPQQTADSQTLSSVVIESPASPRQRRRNHNIVRERNERNSFDFKEFSENVNHLFPESRLQVQRNSISTSNVAPQSASNSPSKRALDTSPSITDPRLWASSDSFICEDFTFYDGKRRDGQNMDFLPPPRSYSQVLLGGRQDDYPDHQDTTDNHSDQLPDNYIQDDGFGGLDPELALALSNDSLEVSCDKVESDGFTDDTTSTEDVFYTASHPPPTSTTPRVIDDDNFHDIHSDCEVSAASQHSTNNVQRGHWIKFDGGSTEHLEAGSNYPPDFSSDNTFSSQHFDEDISRAARASVTSMTSPSSTDDHHASILNLVDPRMVHGAPDPYRGRLIRTYSQRGRRVSKNVLDSVSRRINATDYGKLTEPIPPRYSRAALTMNGGPGLFEESPSKVDNDRDSDNTGRSLQGRKEGVRLMEAPLRRPTTITSPADNVATRTILEPDLPQRVGSVRVPRLSSTLVRRSVSLSIPKVDREVPFQRLPDQRPGSFRKAISGLGALARSFKRKSASNEPVRATPSSSGENRALPRSGASVRRSGSFAPATCKQTPRAPRLPRRAISHRIVTPTQPTADPDSPKF